MFNYLKLILSFTRGGDFFEQCNEKKKKKNEET